MPEGGELAVREALTSVS